MIKTVLYNIAYYKIMKIDIPYFIKKCYLRMSAPVVLTLIIGIVLNTLIQKCVWMNVMIRGVIICIVFCVNSFVFGMDKADRKEIRAFLKRGERL